MFPIASISRIPLPIVIVLSVGVLCGWIPDFIACDYSSFATAFPLFFTFVLMLVNAYTLFFMMRATGVVRYRDALPVFLYLLTTTAFPAIHAWWQLQAVIVLMMIMVQIIHRAYREDETAHDCFLATAFALIASFFLPIAIVMVPLIWLAYILLRSMHLRTALGSLIAIGLFAIYIAVAVFFFDMPVPSVNNIADSLCTPFRHLDLVQIVFFSVLLLAHFGFLIAIAVRIDRDSAGQQALLILFFLFFLPPAAATLFFRQRDSVTRGVVFCLYAVFLLAAYASYWLLR
ncbi:MAG: DUF6427 family protein [Paludibacteraceae bacterium]